MIDWMKVAHLRVLAIGAALACAMALSACVADSPDVTAAANDAAFMSWFAGVGDDIAADPNYNRMPIDTSAQESEFGTKLHQAYRVEITEAEFGQWANATYPGHDYEVDFILRRLPR